MHGFGLQAFFSATKRIRLGLPLMLEPRNKKSGQRVVGGADFSLLSIDTPTIMESKNISYSNIVKQ